MRNDHPAQPQAASHWPTRSGRHRLDGHVVGGTELRALGRCGLTRPQADKANRPRVPAAASKVRDNLRTLPCAALACSARWHRPMAHTVAPFQKRHPAYRPPPPITAAAPRRRARQAPPTAIQPAGRVGRSPLSQPQAGRLRSRSCGGLPPLPLTGSASVPLPFASAPWGLRAPG